MRAPALAAAMVATLLLSAFAVAQIRSDQNRTAASDLDCVTVCAPAKVSVNQSEIAVSAFAAANGNPVSGKTIVFASDELTFPNGNTAETDSNGEARITASAGPVPSSALNSAEVNAVASNEIGCLVEGSSKLTIVRVNTPKPANPRIIVGHYQTDALYTVVLTYTVSPAISGVPLEFAFAEGEGDGVNYPASLEDCHNITDENGKATVKVRSGDLRETITVIGSYGKSSAETDVEIQGITGVVCVSE